MLNIRTIRRIIGTPTSVKIAVLASAAFLLHQTSSNYYHISSMSSGTPSATTLRMPAAYIPHGGGPLPILGDPQHTAMVSFLSSFASTYLPSTPTACLVVSAHWEASLPTIQSGDVSSLYYDYYGFPKESYNLTYPLRPSPDLAKRTASLLDKAGIKHAVDKERGFDHGVFIPMMLLFPEGNVPALQISLVKGLDPSVHIKLGEALAPLRDEGVLILGSGMSYHNMRGFGSPNANLDSVPFHAALRKEIGKDEKSYENKAQALKEWKNLPKAKEVHPREEHLIPLMTILGAAKASGGKGREVFFDDVGGAKSACYLFE